MIIQSNEIVLLRPDDWHTHVRQGDIMKSVLPYTAKYFGRAVIMPNTKPPILTGADAQRYEKEILRVVTELNLSHNFTPVMTIKITDSTTPLMIYEAHDAGVRAGKVYPRGVTTNSEDGLSDFNNDNTRRVFKTMQEVGMLLLLHGEMDKKNILVTKREEGFISTFLDLACDFPGLGIVFEHISTEKAVRLISDMDNNIAGTITLHHLLLTLNDVVGTGVQPHNMCMPIAKNFSDRDALLEAATSGNPKFFLGSDTAPHLRVNKECAHGACGVYSAPLLLPLLTQVFEDAGSLNKLEDFTSVFGAQFYGYSIPLETVSLSRQDWVVPDEYEGIVPFYAGKTLRWKMT